MKRVTGGSSPRAGPPSTILPFPLRLAWLLRGDVRGGAALDDDEAQKDFICWWLVHGAREYPRVPPLGSNEITIAYQPISLQRSDFCVVLPRLAAYLWAHHEEMSARFDLSKVSDHSAFLRWFDQSPFALATALTCAATILPTPEEPHHEVIAGGVNLIGYALAELGVGEDLRLVAMALRSAGIPFCVIARQLLGRPLGSDKTLAEWLVEHPIYDTSILCMTGFDTAALALEAPDLLAASYVIGQWPWELPHWPTPWVPALDLVDEIWASSRYIEGAFSVARRKPVVYMPMAASVAATTLLTRENLGLPDKGFLFLCCFDLHSYAARKNPMGAIEAFRRAFPLELEGVGLIVKAMGAEADPIAWAQLLTAAAADPRIRILEGVLPRDFHLGLIHACNALVSLHRSEGFGRVIAEAMLLRRPVIATGFSGSDELVTSDTALVVAWRPVPVRAGEYPFGDGQCWADPDLDDAARCLRMLFEQKDLRNHLSENAYRWVTARHAPKIVGSRYAARIATIQGRAIPSIEY